MSQTKKVNLKDLAKNKKFQTKVAEASAPDVEMEEVKYDTEGDSEKKFSKVQEFESHLYKLKVAEVMKQTGSEADLMKDPESWTKWEHTHPFRTRDSNGAPQEKSASIAGHFHVIELVKNPKGEKHAPIVKRMSGPMTLGKRIVNGRPKLVPIPVNDWDDHTHEVTYIRTDKVTARRTNAEAAQVVAYEANKGAPPKGAAEG